MNAIPMVVGALLLTLGLLVGFALGAALVDHEYRKLPESEDG